MVDRYGFSIELGEMSDELIEEVVRMCKAELDARRAERREELIQNFCNAFNALKAEFPLVGLIIDVECEDCTNIQEENVLDYFGKTLTPAHFRRIV
jgi:hypothetical protein